MKFKLGRQRQCRTTGFNRILPEIITDFNLAETFIINEIKKKWQVLVGEIIASHSIPERIFKKTLFVNVDHSIYSNEIILMKDRILKNIDDEIASNFIVNIRAEVKRLKWQK